MRLFPEPDEENFSLSRGQRMLVKQISILIGDICRSQKISLEAMHVALWLFHCQVKLVGLRNFDRFNYACACILVGTKVAEHIVRPSAILKQMRILLREQRQLPPMEDSQEKMQQLIKQLFDAELNLMINIGFDFDIEIALSQIGSLRAEVSDEGLLEKVKQTLTSLYKSDVVVYYEARDILLTALQISLGLADIDVALSGYSASLVQGLMSGTVAQLKTYFIRTSV